MVTTPKPTIFMEGAVAMRLSLVWSHFEADKRILGFSPHTLKGYGIQMQLLIRELGDMEAEQVTQLHLKDYLAKASGHLKNSSLGHRIRALRSIFRYAHEEGIIPLNPAYKLKEPKEDQRIPKFFIEEDVVNLKISCESPRDYALVEFLQTTGCRVGEIQKLNIQDINWENCSAVVNGKGSKQREIYFTTECKVWLKKYLDSRKDDCEALFVTEKRPINRLGTATIRYTLKRIASRGKVQTNVYPHRYRHSFACRLMDNGAPMEFIQSMLGHTKISTTQIYAHLRGERRKELYKRYY
jgi:site-specific recombinase XerD